MAIAYRDGQFSNTNDFPGSTKATSAVPAATVLGDLLLCFVHLEKIGAVMTPPAGWTTLGQVEQTGGATNFRLAMFTSVAITAGGTNFDITWDATSTWWAAQTIAYSGVNVTSTEFPVAMAPSTSSTTIMRGPSVTPTQRDSMLLMFGSNKTGAGAGPPTNFTERVDIGNSYAAEFAQAAPGASGVADAVFGVAAWNIGGMVAVQNPAPSGAPHAMLKAV